jgi:hypothetical protein
VKVIISSEQRNIASRYFLVVLQTPNRKVPNVTQILVKYALCLRMKVLYVEAFKNMRYLVQGQANFAL